MLKHLQDELRIAKIKIKDIEDEKRKVNTDDRKVITLICSLEEKLKAEVSKNKQNDEELK